MNIFVLNKDPIKAAQYMCDKHVVKMILESAQLLCGSIRINCNLTEINNVELYKLTHKNHPCSIWTRENIENYRWLYNHFIALCDEYTFRYGKVHLCDKKFRNILNLYGECKEYPTSFIMAMPEEFKNGDVVNAYREYYKYKVNTINMTWTKRVKPDWLI